MMPATTLRGSDFPNAVSLSPSIYQLDGKPYHLRFDAKLSIDDKSSDSDAVIPVAVLPFAATGPPSADAIFNILTEFKEEDDVFCSSFETTVIAQTAEEPDNQDVCKTVRLGDREARMIQVTVSEDESIAKGPYFLTRNTLHEAWRLYPDTADAFFAPVQPSTLEKGAYSWLGVNGCFGPTLPIAVPSRLYYGKDPAKPLNGLRVAIKDNYDLQGLPTAVSNKSFLKFKTPANRTAPSIQSLIEKGAVIVGKTKMTAFADREYPPSDWIDYHCPFNPRGDGYLVPEGSSTGSAVAVAAYDWLDFAMGTDSSASLRAPAAAQGIFGLRSTWGSISTEGIVPLVQRFDVAGFMARDIRQMQLIAKHTYPNPTTPATKFPTKILYNPDWIESSNLPPVKALIEDFVQKLEAFLGVTRTMTDVEKEWTEDNPMGTGKTFEEEFLRTYERIHGPATLEYQSAWAKEYADKFGKAPYLPPALKNRWPYVKTMTPEDVAGAHKQVDAYRDWFQSKFLSSDDETASSAIMVDRWTWRLNYRDTLKETPNAGRDYGFGQEFSPSFAEVPELVICIGQYEYDSVISQTKEYAPVAASLIGAKGSEHMLLKLAEEFLAFANIPGKVLTGKTPFPAPEHRLPNDWRL